MSLFQGVAEMFYAVVGRLYYPCAGKIFTHLTAQEKYALYKLARGSVRRGGQEFLEIGSYLGASSSVIAAALTGPSQVLYCIDTWQNDAMTEGGRDTYSDFVCNTSRYSGAIVPLRGLSSQVATGCSVNFDFMFIDGDHCYEAVKSDVDAWWPKLKIGGTVVLHDIGWADGVRRVVNDMVLDNTCDHGRLPNLFWGTKIG